MGFRALTTLAVLIHTVVLPTVLTTYVVLATVRPSHHVDDGPRSVPEPPLEAQQIAKPDPGSDPSPEPAADEDEGPVEWIAVAHVRRSVVEEALSALVAEHEGLRVIPYQVGDRFVGVKLYGVRPDSLMAAAGFRNGDVLHAVNGCPVMSATCRAPSPADRIDLDIGRRGRRGRVVVFVVPDVGAHAEDLHAREARCSRRAIRGDGDG